MTGIAGSGVLARALEAAFPFRCILLLKSLAIGRIGLLRAAKGWDAGLLVIQTFDDALGVFVFFVLRHVRMFRRRSRRRGRLSRPRGKGSSLYFSARLMPPA
jgi:hypothetical protein